MPDIQTLLDDAAPRRSHPDPVAAVHRRVRRHEARRRAAVAGGATVAVAAAGLAVANGGDARPATVAPLASTPATTAPAPALSTAWRAPGDGPDDPAYAAEYASLTRLVRAHPDVFLSTVVQGSNDARGWLVAVSLGGDADPDAWRARVAAAAGTMPWAFVRCAEPTARYDRVAAELTAAAWPSGATVRTGPYPMAVLYRDHCSVYAGLTGPGLDGRDTAYAEGRWGDDAVVYVKPPPSTVKPSPNSDGTYG